MELEPGAVIQARDARFRRRYVPARRDERHGGLTVFRQCLTQLATARYDQMPRLPSTIETSTRSDLNR